MSVEIISEIAQAHEGSLGIAHSYIDALHGTGVDTIKFQMHIADAESSVHEKFRVNFSIEDKSRFDYWTRMEFEPEQWMGLKQHCEDKGFRFLCSPFSIKAVNLLEKMNVSRYKIASGEILNYLMLDKICKTGKPILLSSGLSSYSEISKTVDFIKEHNGTFAGVFQCTTQYPTPSEKYGLNVIGELKERLKCNVGLSDHSGEIFAPLAAVALGAQMLEMHVVFDRQMFGPDSKSSLTIQDFKTLSEGVRKIESALLNPVDKNETGGYNELKIMFGKSLAVNRNIKKGEILRQEDLETKKPGDEGWPAEDYSKIIGKSVNKDLEINSFIKKEDINE